MTDPDDRRLEELMRAGLAERARQADTSVDLRPDRPGRPGPSPAGHRWRTPLLAAAAVAVALVVTVPLVARGPDGSAPPTGGPTATDQPTDQPTDPATQPATVVPDGWRVESYHGVQVQVPDSWALGGAPMADGGSAGMVQCGGVVDEIANPVQGVDYVGRPVMMTDMCLGIDPTSLPEPTESYVWLGSPVDQGGSGWSNGYESETVEVEGVRVTVTTDDAALREQIVGTLQAVPRDSADANGCPPIAPEPSGEVVGEVTGMAVCAYQRELDELELLWSGRAGAAAATTLLDAVAGGGARTLSCRTTEPEYQRVVLRVESEAVASYVVRPACGLIEAPDGTLAGLTAATVEPWALDGVRAYVNPPPDAGPGLAPYFRQVMG